MCKYYNYEDLKYYYFIYDDGDQQFNYYKSINKLLHEETVAINEYQNKYKNKMVRYNNEVG